MSGIGQNDSKVGDMRTRVKSGDVRTWPGSHGRRDVRTWATSDADMGEPHACGHGRRLMSPWRGANEVRLMMPPTMPVWA